MAVLEKASRCCLWTGGGVELQTTAADFMQVWLAFLREDDAGAAECPLEHARVSRRKLALNGTESSAGRSD